MTRSVVHAPMYGAQLLELRYITITFRCIYGVFVFTNSWIFWTIYYKISCVWQKVVKKSRLPYVYVHYGTTGTDRQTDEKKY